MSDTSRSGAHSARQQGDMGVHDVDSFHVSEVVESKKLKGAAGDAAAVVPRRLHRVG